MASLLGRQQLLDRARWPGASEEEPLGFIAPGGCQHLELGRGLHALCHRAQPEGLAQAQRGGHDGPVLAARLDPGDEGPVYFEAVERVATQGRERGVARTEAVDGKMHPEAVQLPKGVLGTLRRQCSLGHLELHALRVQLQPLQGSSDITWQCRVLKLTG